MKILLAEDNRDTANYVVKGLEEAGHIVVVANTGPDALFHITQQDLDAVILDRMLPGMDGLTVLRMVRAGDIDVPTLLLTAMGSIADRVEGLESGANDYLVKPFAFDELLARIHVMVRRPAMPTAPIETKLVAGDLEIDLRLRRVTRGGRVIDLQPREVLMLEELMRNKHRVMTKTMLLDRVWDFNFDPRTNIVETHISRLRAKLNAGFVTDAIVTVRGAGYTIRMD